MTLKEALNSALQQLEANHIGSPRLNAETLLMFALSCNRAYLYAHPEQQLSPEEQGNYFELIAERASGKPAQYITGHQEFWGLDFIVTPAVLIPRPETEHVIETVLELARAKPRCKLVDVGTGSGCISLALAKELPLAEVHAVDVSPEALEVARVNAARLELDARVRFHHSDLMSAFEAVPQFDFVVSNPPYVSLNEPEKVQRQVREFEPKVAVFSGETGLEAYQRLIPQARKLLKPGGWLVMEIGYSIADCVRQMLAGWAEINVTPDLQGIPRVVSARRAP
ncbi:MAG: peptide chain release factor N(5)-glutamine methyltransferase [Acidobacteriales bacterium]|nr:peptide chain release factor N(5)-glutamine methyltransferase [Terriglobales bacterium]